MPSDYVIDSYAWIEYFRGTETGKKVRPFVEGGSAATSVLTLAELREKYLREKWSTFSEDAAYITSRTLLTQVDREIAILAGEINHRRKTERKGWGMADSLILATARVASAKVVTGDRHFEDLDEAILV